MPHKWVRCAEFCLVSAIVLVAPMWLAAQGAPAKGSQPYSFNPANPNYGTLHMQTTLGSFKLLPKDDLAEGRVEMSFAGTLLLVQAKGDIQISSGLRKEYEGHGRQVYFGRGTAVIEGRFRAIQWFGRDLKAKWIGDGVARLYGEFDEKLSTGVYYYDNPSEPRAWGTFGTQAILPEPQYYGTGTPVPRKKTGNP